LSLHLDSLETRLAFRTRILDYLWAGLPMIVTTGDATSDLVADYGVGEVVGYQDETAAAQALLRLLDEPRTARAAGFARAREALTWERAAAPLAAFCRSPHRAPDRLNQQTPQEAAFAVQAAQAERLDYLEHAVVRAEAEAAHWRELAARYEQGRFIRTMRGLDRLARRVWPRP
jgi:hypothetical protein